MISGVTNKKPRKNHFFTATAENIEYSNFAKQYKHHIFIYSQDDSNHKIKYI